MQILTFLDQAARHHSPVMAEKILGIHSNRTVEGDLKVTNADPQSPGDRLHHVSRLVSDLKEIAPLTVHNMLALPVKKLIAI